MFHRAPLVHYVLSTVVVVFSACFPYTVKAERRAFVVGINAYANVPQLSSPVRDANKITKELNGLGFTTTTVLDAKAGRTSLVLA
jgi:hypothetical protein